MNDESSERLSPAAAWFQQNLELVQHDLLAAVLRHQSAVGHQCIAHALIETTGTVLAAILQAEPGARAAIETKLDELKLFVATTEQPPQ